MTLVAEIYQRTRHGALRDGPTFAVLAPVQEFNTKASIDTIVQ